MRNPDEPIRDDLPRETMALFLDAESGDPSAQFRLGVHYRNGDAGLPQDLALAHHWLIMAARSGHVHAQVLEGCLLLKEGGWGGTTPPSTVDEWKAAYWFRQSALQGHEGGRTRLRELIARKAGLGPCHSDGGEDLDAVGRMYASMPVDEAENRMKYEDPRMWVFCLDVETMVSSDRFGIAWDVNQPHWVEGTAEITVHAFQGTSLRCPSCQVLLDPLDEQRQLWSNPDFHGHPVRLVVALPRFRCEIHGIVPFPSPSGLREEGFHKVAIL